MEGTQGQGPVRRLLQSSGKGKELAGELDYRAGRAGGGSLWRFLGGGSELGPRVW